MKLIIIIPAYNEEASLPAVLRDLAKHMPHADILVVNDGSVDRTAAIAREHNALLLDLPFNLGIGGAMQAGYLYADRNNYDIAIQFDGDGQHLGAEIPKLLAVLSEGAADLVVGSRFLIPGGYQAPMLRRFGSAIFTVVLSGILGKAVTDSTSGFRAANKSVIRFFSHTYPDDYPEVESLVLLHKKKLTIAEVPVSMSVRTGGRSSITPIRSVYYMTKVLIAIFIDLIKRVR